jgi:hypothetical protein
MKDAETAYADRHQECVALVEKITAALGDMDGPDPTPHWAQVHPLTLARDLDTARRLQAAAAGPPQQIKA